jgi:hypothetical protein
MLFSGGSVSKSGLSYTLVGNTGFFHGNGNYVILTAGTFSLLNAFDCLVISDVDKDIRYEGGTAKTPVIKSYNAVNENDVVIAWRGADDFTQCIFDGLLLPDFSLIKRNIQPLLLPSSTVSKSGYSYTLTGNVSFLYGNRAYAIVPAGTYTMTNVLDCLVIPNVNKNLSYDGIENPIKTPVIKSYNAVTENDVVLIWRGMSEDVQSIWDNIILFKQTPAYVPYNKVNDRALFTNKLFLFEDEPLAIHKDSLFVDIASSKKCKVSIVSSSSNGLQRLDIQNPLLLNASSLGSTAKEEAFNNNGF